MGGVKSKAWEKEKEWRLVTRLIDFPKIPLRRASDGERIAYFLRLWDRTDPAAGVAAILRRVIVGCRASDDLKASVRAALHQPQMSQVDLTFARENDCEFRLEA